MSSCCSSGDENSTYFSCSTLLFSLNSSDHRHDSGYFSSPSTIESQQTSDDENSSSPIRPTYRRNLSLIDYEKYVTQRKHFDFLSELNQRNAFHLIEKILWNLSTKDLHACSNVSKKWNFILKDFQHRRQLNEVKRNVLKTYRKKSPTPLTSSPMKNLTNLLEIPQVKNDTSTPEKNLHLAASSLTCRYKYLKYLHGPTIPKRCPICAYVSIVDVNDRHGICTNPLCENSFCQCCSGPYHHPSSPCKTSTGPIKSPWRQRPTLSPIFSKKTRTNLRRLLIR